jgi:hypothetical protein
MKDPETLTRPELIRYVKELQRQIITLQELLVRYITKYDA